MEWKGLPAPRLGSSFRETGGQAAGITVLFQTARPGWNSAFRTVAAHRQHRRRDHTGALDDYRLHRPRVGLAHYSFRQISGGPADMGLVGDLWARHGTA